MKWMILISILILASGCTSSSPIIIKSSGTTSFDGYALQINPDGSGSLSRVSDGRPYPRSLGVTPTMYPPGHFDMTALYSALNQAGPLSSLTENKCGIKSVSFGYDLTVTHNGQTSPDIQCGYSPDVEALAALAESYVDETK